MTGSNVPGQIAMRLSGAMDSDQGVAVAALVEQRQVELERRPPVALGHYPRSRAREPVAAPPTAPARARSRADMGDRGTPDRIDERRGVPPRGTRARPGGAPPRPRRAPTGCAGSPPPRPPRSRPARRQAAPRDSASIPSAPEPANRSSTRAPSTESAPEDREQRLAHAVRGRPGGAPPRRDQRTAAEPSRDDAHDSRLTPGSAPAPPPRTSPTSASASSACSGSASSGSSPTTSSA